MITRLQLTILLGVAAIILGVVLHVEGVPVRLVWLGYVPKVVGSLSICVLLFEYVAWKGLPAFVVGRPRLYGTWRGVLRSTWKDPATGKVVDPIPCFIAIEQTFSTIEVRQYTEQSASRSVTARVLKEGEVFVLECTYLNEPPPSARRESPIHYGTMRLSFARGDGDALKGTYWTDRGTCGEIELAERKSKVVDGYARGERLYAPPASSPPTASAPKA